MKKIIFTIMSLMLITSMFAQAPERMSYQAVARDLSGLPLVSTAVNLQFDILQSSSTGAVTYSETQSKTTNQFGLFTAEIGGGTVVSGSFPAIAWGVNAYYLRITVNGDAMPATQLLSVPYALYSKTSGGAGAGLVPGAGIDITGGVITSTLDTSATNEFQTLSTNSTLDTVFLSNNGGFVYIPAIAGDDWGADTVNTSGLNISGNGTVANPLVVIDNDTSLTNELQVLSISNDTIFLTNGGFALLPSSSLWTQGTGSDVYNNSDSIGVGVADPKALLHVSGGGIVQPIALFEKGGLLSGNIHINHTGSNGSGINFQNGGTTTSSINSSTANVLSLTSQFVEVGNSPKTGKLNVASTSSAANPTLLLHETSTGFSRIKHTNTVAGGKYWITEAGINAADASSGYSISYFDGTTANNTFIVYGDDKVGINNLAAPLASLHVMDNTAAGGVVSEGFSQEGAIIIARNNFSAPNRGAIQNGDVMGVLSFSGHDGVTFGKGPQLKATATENYTSTANGSELTFSTIVNGTNTDQEVLRLLNDGTVEVPVNLRLLNGAGTAGEVLTSDIAGNATWQALSGTGWSLSGNTGTVPGTDFIGTTDAVSLDFRTNNTNRMIIDANGSVGIGTTSPGASLHIANGAFGSSGSVALMSNNTGATNSSAISFFKSRGTEALPSNVLANDELGRINFSGYNTVSYGGNAASIVAVADENFGSTAQGTYLAFYTTLNGTAGESEAMRIADDGNVGIGTPSPSAKLHLNGTLKLDNIGGVGPLTGGEILTYNIGTGNAEWQTAGGSSFWNGSAGYTELAISTDNVGVGLTPNYKLDVAGDLNTNTLYRIDGVTFLDNRSTSTLVGATGNTTLTGVDNTLLGQNAGQNSTSASESTFLGKSSGNANTIGSQNVAVGANSSALNVLGWANVAVGFNALNKNTTSGNTAVGFTAMQENTAGIQNAALGYRALRNNVTGNGSTAIGYGALNNTIGDNNTGLGYNAGSINTTGINNTFLGHAANAAAGQTNLTNATAIGSGAIVNTSNSLVLGNNANVGIGTSSPSAKLDIVGTMQLVDGNQAAGRILTSDATGNATWASNSIYTESGLLNSASFNVPSGLTVVGPPLSIIKTYGDSKIEVTFNSRITSGTFLAGTNFVRFEIRIDGNPATFDTKGALTLTNINEFISMFAVFEGLSIGAHTIQVYSITNGTGSNGIVLDAGGLGGRMISKETF